MEGSLLLAIILLSVVVPVVALVVGAHLKEKMRLRHRELEVLGSKSAERAAQFAAHTERLEERMRVLERIVTDKGLDVSVEIEKLRDERVS